MFRRFVGIAFAVSAVALVPLGVLAANVSFPVDTTVSFSGGDTVTAVGGSTADAFTVSTASATVTVTSGTSSSTFRSMSKAFVIDANTATATSTCTGSGDILTVTGTGTTTFSLASSGCTGGTAFRSIIASGSGGSPRSPVSGPMPSATSSTSTVPLGGGAATPPRVSSGSAGVCVQPVARTSGMTARFTRNLQFGMRKSDEVRRLQTFLVEEGVYPEALLTGNYFSLTRAAMERYHLKYCIAGPGDRGYGRFGPASRTTASRILGF